MSVDTCLPFTWCFTERFLHTGLEMRQESYDMHHHWRDKISLIGYKLLDNMYVYYIDITHTFITRKISFEVISAACVHAWK